MRYTEKISVQQQPAAIKGVVGDDGFIQRFQMMVWPEVPGEWQIVNQWDKILP